MRQDSNGILFLTGMGITVSVLSNWVLISDAFRYKHVIYVDASSSSSIKADLQTWARTLGDGHERDSWEDALCILSTVPQDEQWILILDNADNPTLDLAPFLPKNCKLTILITSRNRSTRNVSTVYHLELGEMDPDEALATLLQAAGRQLPLAAEEMKGAHDIMKELGCLAVALVQAGAYCFELSSTTQGVFQPYSFTQYLSLFHLHRAQLMKKAESSSFDGYKQSAYTTFDLSYQALQQQARDFLHLISFFYHTDIPVEALATAAKNSFTPSLSILSYTEGHEEVFKDLKTLLLNGGKWDEMHIHDVVRALRSFSLVSVTSVGDSLFLQLHPLVQAWCRDMNSAVSEHYKAMAIQVLTACGRKDSFALNLRILPHLLDILDQTQLEQLHVNDLMAFGPVLRQQGHYRKASRLFEAALELMKQSKAPEDLNTFKIMEYMADVYVYEGRWSEAEELLLELLNQYKSLLGAEHLSTITVASDLAFAYHDQGRWDESERLRVEVLKQRRKILGMNHPDTISAAANLAFTYYSQGRLSKAEELQQEVLGQSRRILGMEHPNAITAVGSLAATYHLQERWSEAEKLQLEALQQSRKILGIEHPDTINAAANLAATYNKQDRWEETLDLFAPTVQLSLKVLGKQHPSTQRRVKGLASVYERLGKQKEAQETRVLLL